MIQNNDDIIKKILDDLLHKDARKEASIILSMATPLQLADFLQKYKDENYNVCCLILDSIKLDLVRMEKMQMRTNDFFGHPLFDDEKDETK